MTATALLETVVCRGRVQVLLPGSYWHLTADGGHLLHNAVLHEGLSITVSAVAEMAGLEQAVTMYSMKAAQDPKEMTWEAARKTVDAKLPTRSKTLYLFDSEDTAKTALASWFGREQRTLVQARIVAGSAIHRSDARWLDGTDESAWADRAARYWRGEMTDNPMPEILVHGSVYFPQWGEPWFHDRRMF